jgi:hypothetical protein
MASLRAFFSGLIDYAGLFPPAKLDMSAAVRAYAEQCAGPDRDLLGRFVVPSHRLADFSEAAAPFLSGDRDPWKVSVIVGDDIETAREEIDSFNADNDSLAICDTIEMRVSSYEEVARAIAHFSEPFSLFLEPNPHADPAVVLREIAATSASAKLRTGGVTPDAIPHPDHVLRFIQTCVDEGIPLKATAGLHHAIRGVYPLTYEPGSPTAMMYGYLNIFLAAAFCAAGTSPSAVLGVIEETDASSFEVDDRGVWWEDHLVNHEELAVVRQAVATSFGSCSFTEPVNEARNLGLV